MVSGRPVVKFESGYTVETVFDGSKLGIEPFAVQVLPGGELLVLDSDNSNIYKISLPLSRCKWVYFSSGLVWFSGFCSLDLSDIAKSRSILLKFALWICARARLLLPAKPPSFHFCIFDVLLDC